MGNAVRASLEGLAIVDRARKQIGWNRQAIVWVEAAKTSVATLKRFWRREPIQIETFIAICQAVAVTWEEVVDPNAMNLAADDSPIPYQDWGEAPKISEFCGRDRELDLLNQWIIQDNCQLVVLLGMGGIGKTALTVKLAEQIQDKFDYLIWRSLRSSPSIDEFLDHLIQFLAPNLPIYLPEDTERKISLLIQHLSDRRCLLIIDNIEAILRSGDLYGSYQQGYEDYGRLFRRLGEERHQSCSILISREKPQGLAALEGNLSLVRSLQLTGLVPREAREILHFQGLSGEESWEKLIQLYRGHPLALKLISGTIQDLFNGNVTRFIECSTLVISDLRDVLEEQFDRISKLEKKVVLCLAESDRAISLSELQQKESLSFLATSGLMEALASLSRRSLIEKIPNEDEDGVLYTLQPVVRKYTIKYNLSRT